MNEILLDNIPIVLDGDHLLTQAGIKEEDAARIQAFKNMVKEASAVCKPKALYRPLYIDHNDNDQVVMEGNTFKSRILAVNLSDVHRIFVFIATCGTELDEWAKEKEGMLEQHWAGKIMETVIFKTGDVMRKHIHDHANPGQTSFMTPGSLEDWPIEEQRTLFSIFGYDHIQASLGVQLTPECMMIPAYSISGIIFPTETHFENCMLCPREGCPGRRAPYDRDLYQERYGMNHPDGSGT